MATNAGVLDTRMLAEAPEGVEKRLWQAVIVTTIQEWLSGPLRSKRQAEEYLFQDQRDFPLVCQSAGMDAGRLRAKLNRLLRQNPALAASADLFSR
jgi:predicted nucleic acid-binding protein